MFRCNTCGGYVYKGKKFNSRQELAEGETYLSLKIFRFYIKCPTCVSEIVFKVSISIPLGRLHACVQFTNGQEIAYYLFWKFRMFVSVILLRVHVVFVIVTK